MQQNCDLFYECFEISDVEESDFRPIEKSKIAKKWLESIKSELIESADLEKKLNGFTLF